MHARLLAIAAAAASLAAAPASAAETCHSRPGGQFGDARVCVSSVLPPQAGNSYGPDNLLKDDSGAWCEGARGPGLGESVTIHQKPRMHFRTLGITNGYAKSDETFRRNGRIKRALIETERGFRKTVTLKDTREYQKVVIPTTRTAWIRLTIVEVYPGTSASDTCLSGFAPNLEELNR